MPVLDYLTTNDGENGGEDQKKIEIPNGIEILIAETQEEKAQVYKNYFQPLQQMNSVRINVLREGEITYINSQYFGVPPSLLKPATDIYAFLARNNPQNTHLIIRIDEIVDPRIYVGDRVKIIGENKSMFTFLSSLKSYGNLFGMPIDVCAGEQLPGNHMIVSSTLNLLGLVNIKLNIIRDGAVDPKLLTEAQILPNGLTIPPKFSSSKEVQLLNQLGKRYGNSNFVSELSTAYHNSLDLEK